MASERTAEQGLRFLREPVPAENIGKLPRVTCRNCSKGSCQDQRHNKRKCPECDAYVSPQHTHLDYVGHAETTDRLLEADLYWTWEPLAFDADGLPKFDQYGGLWIKLTVCGLTRLGYGSAENGGFKAKGDLVKEVIGDALRNASMRFGHALNLWAKTDLHDRRPDGDDGAADQSQALAALERKGRRPADDEFAVRPAEPTGAEQGREPWDDARPDRPSPTAGRGAPMSEPQMRKLQAMMKGWSSDEKHGVLAVILGRPVASAAELTVQDATVAIDALNKRRDDLIARVRGQAQVGGEPVQGEQLLADLTAAIESAADGGVLEQLWRQAKAALSAGMLDQQQFGVLDQLGAARAEELAQPVRSAA
jgi:hypothetical protein